jgi:hypothetical protein
MAHVFVPTATFLLHLTFPHLLSFYIQLRVSLHYAPTGDTCIGLLGV